jgi:hypothetical protein
MMKLGNAKASLWKAAFMLALIVGWSCCRNLTSSDPNQGSADELNPELQEILEGEAKEEKNTDGLQENKFENGNSIIHGIGTDDFTLEEKKTFPQHEAPKSFANLESSLLNFN